MSITLLISGPLHITSINAIQYYLSCNVNVVYSTWKPGNKEDQDLFEILKDKLDSQYIIISDLPDIKNIDNTQNIYYHGYCVLQGLYKVNTEYVIKIRSNCAFYDINPLLEKIITNKVITISAFFRPNKDFYYYYCPSDFVIGTTTNECINIFNYLIKDLQVCDLSIYSVTPAERKICKATIISRGLEFKLNDLKYATETMKLIYDIVDVNSLKPFLNYHSSEKDLKWFDHCSDISISNILHL